MTAIPPTPDSLDLLFAALVRTSREQRPEKLARGLDVSEILELIPYKDVRGEIGATTDDDYGQAMTRLLAGEKGFVFGDDLMQDDLRAELVSKNPDLQAYRSYLNTRVTLAQEQVRAVLDGLGPAPARDAKQQAAFEANAVKAAKSAALSAASPAPSPRDRLAISKERPVPNATASMASGVGNKAARPGCKYCGQPLPQGRDVRFCPHCGQDLSMLRCGACSAEIEPGWKFCVACGRAASG